MKILKFVLATVAASCLAFAGGAGAQGLPANAIETINVAQQGADISIRIDLKEPLQQPPAGFSIANPAKIAFDFPSTANGLGKNSQPVNEGDLRSLNIVQVGERTRLVLNMTRSMNYSTRLDGKSLYVTLSPIGSVGGSLAQRVTRFSEESSVGSKHSVQDIVFRRGKDGEARVVVDLSDAGTGIDIRQQGASLVVEFVKTSVPEHLRRKLDVTDFGTPVTAVETSVRGENVRMTISPKGLWEHNAYQTDNQFVVEVKKVVEDPNKLVQGSKIGYQGPRVSINYQNGDVRALLRLMSEELGLNAVISETVSGTTTLVLKDVPADQVVDIIFQQKGLDMRKNGNVILIAPRDELATREKLEFEAKQQVNDLEPIKLESFQLSYQKAADVARLILGSGGAQAGGAQTGGGTRILSKRGNITSDPTSNIVFVNDIPSKLDEIRALIKAIDVGSRQVMIEARVVEANDNFNRDLGARLSFTSTKENQLGGSGIYAGGGAYGPAGQTSNRAINVNLPSYSNAGGALTFSLFNQALSRILNVELAALEADGVGKIISSPRVMTANNVKAKMEDGTEIPYVVVQTTGGATTNTVSFKPAKLSLEVTPQITPDGMIRMKLLVKKEDPDWTRAVQGNPPIKSSIVETDVLVENGGTVVIGGVYKTDNSTNTEKVPFFGDLWGIGWLFKVQSKDSARRELLIFITPKVVNDRMNLN
jgi:type IV pilus assembly protein PilQ